MDYLERRYRQRLGILQKLFPWDAPNYGIDEQWAVFYPYGVETESKRSIALEVRVTNHSPVEREFSIQPHVPDGMTIVAQESKKRLKAGASASFQLVIRVDSDSENYIVTSDILSVGMEFHEWIEALITVK